MGARVGARARLPKRARVVEERLTNKTEPEGTGQENVQSAPFGSKVGSTLGIRLQNVLDPDG
jgi:hypothetical protein